MESISGMGGQISISAEAAARAVKDNANARPNGQPTESEILNSSAALSGALPILGQQFQQKILNGAGIGNKLDVTV